MNCEICGCDADIYNILPISRPDGKLDTIACTPCAIKSGAFCEKHQQIHTGFKDGATACLKCIVELKEAKMKDCPRLLRILKKKLPKKEYTHLFSEAEKLSRIIMQESEDVIMGWLATKAYISKAGIDAVVSDIIKARSARSVMPEQPIPEMAPLILYHILGRI